MTDRRPQPRGVIPRNVQTWLMVGLAIVILAIIVFTGRPEPARRQSVAALNSSPPLEPEPERLRDYQERLRALDARARQEAITSARPGVPVPVLDERPTPSASLNVVPLPQAPPAVSPVQTERARREYDSLFAGNLVSSRRPEAQALLNGDESSRRAFPMTTTGASSPLAPPSLDDVAAAVMRATNRYAQPVSPGPADGASNAVTVSADRPVPSALPASTRRDENTPKATGPISARGPQHRLLEGTVIDTVLTNRLDGSAVAPVVCLVTNPVYSHSGQDVLVPAGARIIGETKPVQALGDTRLAVAFHRLEMPDGRTYTLDEFSGMNQLGDTGLRDQVNQHYWSTFGASGAVGLISGLAQYVATGGIGRGDGTRTVVIAGGLGDATSQATMQVMNRFLNRLPQITIREGHRIKVYLTSDLELPAYDINARGGESTVTTDVRR